MDSSCKGEGFKTIWKQIHAQEKKLGQKRFFFQSPFFVVATYDFWWFVCPLTTFLFLGRIAWQWYYWNPCTKGKVLRPISGKWMHKNQFKCKKIIIIAASMLYMQVSVCPSVCLSGCLSVCPSANYSHISWHIYSGGVSIESLCSEEGFKTIWKEIHAQEKNLWQKSFFFNHLSLL